MHKGYTLNYFINFFKKIPDHRWCTGEMQKDGTTQHCALGHLLRNASTTYNNTKRKNFPRNQALVKFFGNENVIIVNDGQSYKALNLGKTPRGRMLRALRNRKRYG